MNELKRRISNMKWQPIEEKNAERELITDFANKIRAKIIKLQEDDDDGEADGIIERDGWKYSVEARRKGYPNHSGEVCLFSEGWETWFLLRDDGILLNTSTIMNHKDKGFLFVVQINGYAPRACAVTPQRVDELLKRKTIMVKSTNKSGRQPAKAVPLNWFKEY